MLKMITKEYLISKEFKCLSNHTIHFPKEEQGLVLSSSNSYKYIITHESQVIDNIQLRFNEYYNWLPYVRKGLFLILLDYLGNRETKELAWKQAIIKVEERCEEMNYLVEPYNSTKWNCWNNIKLN